MLRKITLYFIFINIFCVSAQKEYPEFGNVTVEELKEEFYPLDSTAHAAYLYKEKKLTYIKESEGWFQKTNVYDKEGFNRAIKKISYFNSEKGDKERISKIEAYTYTIENNEIQKVKLHKKEIFEVDNGKRWKMKKFTMPNLQKGAIIEWKYQKKSPFTLYIDKLKLQHNIPIKEYFAVLAMPEYFVFKLYKTGKLPVEISQFSEKMNGLIGKQNFYVIETDSVPSFKEEAFMSNRNNFIEVSS